ncbi:MAG: tetratricopeptide repeat protein [Blastocatellia bacterium]
MAKTVRKKGRVSVKDMKFKNDPMIRFYERTQDWLQERGRPVVIAIGVLAGITVLYVAGSYFFEYRKATAEVAFGQAVEKFNATVQDPVTAAAPATTPTVGKTYFDEQTKWRESAEAFERLANDYSGYYGSIGRYYAGVSYLHLERDKGIALLQQVAEKNDQPTSGLARLALAEAYAASGDTDKAISLYQQLLSSTSSMRPAVQLGLGKTYEKAGDTQNAVEAYMEVAKSDRSSSAGAEAEKRVAALAPGRVKEIPPAATTFTP